MNERIRYDPDIFRRKMRQTYAVLIAAAAFFAFVAYKVMTSP